MSDLLRRLHARRSLAACVASLMLCAGLAIAQPAVQPAGQPAIQPAAQPAAEAHHDDTIFRPYGMREPRPKTPGTIRLATYNVENLFDDVDDPALSGQYEDRDQRKPDDACKAAAAAIKAIDADVLALEEIESLDALKWFMSTYMPDSPYKFVASVDAGDERGIEQAVLSKFPIKSVKNWPKADLEGKQPDVIGRRHNDLAGQPMKAHRSPLMVEVEVPASSAPAPDPKADPKADPKPDAAPYRLTLFVVHMKSGKDFGFWREAESKKLLSLIDEVSRATPTDAAPAKGVPDRNIAVLGDFNATTDAASIGLLLAGGLTDLTPSAKADPKSPDKAWVTHSSGRAIDHILVNAALLGEVVKDSEFVLGTPTRPEGTDYRTTPTPPGYASDHFPVVVDLVPRD